MSTKINFYQRKYEAIELRNGILTFGKIHKNVRNYGE